MDTIAYLNYRKILKARRDHQKRLSRQMPCKRKPKGKKK
jgi:hypothetical protein